MSILIIPVSQLDQAKIRLREVFSRQKIKEFTLAMFKDICQKTLETECFSKKIVYCNTQDVLELSRDFGFIPIKEKRREKSPDFNIVINEISNIVIERFHPINTLIVFADLILISPKNFVEISTLLEKKHLLICPSVNSLGISIIGRSPPDVIETCFSNFNNPSLIAQMKLVRKKNLKKVALYDSFRAGFDVDLKEHVIRGYNYLKIFKLTNTETFKFLKRNLKNGLKKNYSKII